MKKLFSALTLILVTLILSVCLTSCEGGDPDREYTPEERISAFFNGGVVYKVEGRGNKRVAGVVTYVNTPSKVRIKKTYLGAPVTTICSGAFENCSTITSVVIADNVTSIGELAFANCTNLKSITLGKGLSGNSNDYFIKGNGIAYNAFRDCRGVVEIVNNSGLDMNVGSNDVAGAAFFAKDIHSGRSRLVRRGNYLFYTYDGVNYLVGHSGKNAKLVLPNSYNGKKYVISQYAFLDRDNMTSVTISKGVSSIETNAFCDCSNLVSVTIERGAEDIDIGIRAFSSTKIVEVINHSSLDITARSSDYGSVASSALEVHSGPSKIVKVNGYLFYTYDGVNYLLGYTKKAQDLKLPKSYRGQNYEVHSAAFADRVDIKSVTVPKSVTAFGIAAFYECRNIERVYIDDLSAWCNMSFGIGFNSNPLSIGKPYINGELVSNLVIPDGVTSISDYAFANCSTITSVTIPDSVISIGNSAFSSCTKIVEVINHSSLDITAGSNEHGEVAKSAKVVHSGKSLIVDVNDYLFFTHNGVNYLLGYNGKDTELVLPDSYNGEKYEIYSYAFSYSNEITSIVIPRNVAAFGTRAFFPCHNLTVIKYSGSKSDWSAVCDQEETGALYYSYDCTIIYNYTE